MNRAITTKFWRTGKVCGVVVMFALGLSWSGGVFPQTPLEVKEVDRLNGEVVQLHQQGRYPEALKRAKQALELAENTLGPEHPETASSVNNLGFLYQAMGQYDQARSALSLLFA